MDVLIGHDYKEAFCSILVRLQLVVGAVHSSASSEEEQQFTGRMRIIGRLGNVYFNVVKLRDLLVAVC